MRRRRLLAALAGAAAIAGCSTSAGDTATPPETTSSPTPTDEADATDPTTTYPAVDCQGNALADARPVAAADLTVELEPASEVNGARSGEHAKLVNRSGAVVDVRGHRLRYDSGESYTLDLRTLSPGETVFVYSRGHGDSQYDTCPPTHVRDAGFDDPVLADGEAIVALVDGEGTVVGEWSYDD